MRKDGIKGIGKASKQKRYRDWALGCPMLQSLGDEQEPQKRLRKSNWWDTEIPEECVPWKPSKTSVPRREELSTRDPYSPLGISGAFASNNGKVWARFGGEIWKWCVEQFEHKGKRRTNQRWPNSTLVSQSWGSLRNQTELPTKSCRKNWNWSWRWKEEMSRDWWWGVPTLSETQPRQRLQADMWGC